MPGCSHAVWVLFGVVFVVSLCFVVHIDIERADMFSQTYREFESDGFRHFFALSRRNPFYYRRASESVAASISNVEKIREGLLPPT
jgi:hypothetical protein